MKSNYNNFESRHGHRFAVLGVEKLNHSVSLETIKEMDRMGLLKRNFDRPPIKDTVTVPAGGYTIIRFVADNPGAWFFHCHLDFHLVLGLALIVRVGNENDLPEKPPGWPQFGDYYSQFENEIKKNGANISTSKLFNLCFILIILIFKDNNIEPRLY
jgi:L-ascorbate oxidase